MWHSLYAIDLPKNLVDYTKLSSNCSSEEEQLSLSPNTAIAYNQESKSKPKFEFRDEQLDWKLVLDSLHWKMYADQQA